MNVTIQHSRQIGRISSLINKVDDNTESSKHNITKEKEQKLMWFSNQPSPNIYANLYLGLISKMDIIISIFTIFGYNNIHYEIEAGSSLPQIPEDLG